MDKDLQIQIAELVTSLKELQDSGYSPYVEVIHEDNGSLSNDPETHRGYFGFIVSGGIELPRGTGYKVHEYLKSLGVESEFVQYGFDSKL